MHYIGQVGKGGALRAPFDWLTDGKLEWEKVPDVYDRVWLGEESFDYVSGTKHFIARMSAPIVISDAGAMNTYDHLLPREHRAPRMERALDEVGASVGYVCLYLGFEQTDAELGLTGTNLWIYPNEDHDGNMARYLADSSAPFPLVYVSFPSAKDKTFQERHPGRATVDVIVPARYEWFAAWEDTRWKKRGPDYEALKAKFTERILEIVFAKVPSLRGKVAIAELSMPLTTRHFAAMRRS